MLVSAVFWAWHDDLETTNRRSWHHVINRGMAKRPLFETRGDTRFFLARLAQQFRLGRLGGVHRRLLQTEPSYARRAAEFVRNAISPATS